MQNGTLPSLLPPSGGLPKRCSGDVCFSGRQHYQAGASAPRWSRRVLLKPCQVTNTEGEMHDPRVPLAYQNEKVNLGRQYPDPYQEGPRAARINMFTQVQKTFIDGLYTDEINEKDTEYWFTEPPDGWPTEDEIAYILPRAETKPISAQRREPGRTALRDLQPGTIMTGTVTALMYYHGVQVDIGAEYDGLIPVHTEEQWRNYFFSAKYDVCTGVADDFSLGQQVTVCIHKTNDRPRCRWPIQLEVLDPDVQHKLTPPDEWVFPFDLRGVRSWVEAEEITGRGYEYPGDLDESLEPLTHDLTPDGINNAELLLKNKEWCLEESGLTPDDLEEITAQRRFQDVFEEYRKKAARQAATAAAVGDAVAAAEAAVEDDSAEEDDSAQEDDSAEEPEKLRAVEIIEDEEQFEMVISD